MSSTVSVSTLSPARKPWIAGPIPDTTWVVLAPVVAWLALAALWRFSGLSDFSLYAILFAFIVTGHHMPGWLRAFGEPDVYERHKARLWVSLLFVPALVIIPTAYGFGFLALCVAASFDLWHVAMQQHGFGRIYAAKRGEVDRFSARLDLACVLVWYATVVMWSDSWMQGIAAAFRRAGLPLFSALDPELWRALRWTALCASLALLAAYAARSFVLWRSSRAVALHKHALHAVAFAVLALSYQDSSWYRAQSVQNAFHALQYFFLVWVFGHLSVHRDPRRPRAFYRALFTRRRGIALFVLAVALYGFGAWALTSSNYRLSGWSVERAAQVIGSIGIASLLLHFYVDAFIWKVRGREVRRTLDIQAGAETAARRSSHLRGALHALAYFGLPIAVIALLGAGRRAGSQAENLRHLAAEAALFPESATARYDHGAALERAGETEKARVELVEALRLSPTTEGPAFALAQIARRERNPDSEIAYLRSAIDAAPDETNLHYLLGVALLEKQDLGAAETEFRTVLELDPEYAGAHLNLGLVLRQRGRVDLALEHLERAYALEPERSETVCHLAGALAASGRAQDSLKLLQEFRARHPGDVQVEEFERALRSRL